MPQIIIPVVFQGHPRHNGTSKNLHKHIHLHYPLFVISLKSRVIKTDSGNKNPVTGRISLTPIFFANSGKLNSTPYSSITVVVLNRFVPDKTLA